jgi:cytochrome c-type biogenesis protein CcsB
MKALFKLIPWFFVALFGCEVLVIMLPRKDGEFHVSEFGRLPVLLNGRIQPFDSLARNCLLQIRSTGDVPLEEVPSWKFWHHPKKLKSSEWLLEVMTRPELADTRPIFLIHHAELLGELKLEEKGIAKSGLRYYTFKQIEPVSDEILEQGRQAGQVKAEEQTTFQKQVAKLANAVVLYQRLKVSLQPEGMDDFSKQLEDFVRNMGPARSAAQVPQTDPQFDKTALERITPAWKQFEFMAQYAYPLVVPPQSQALKGESWENMGASVLRMGQQGQVDPAAAQLAAMATAYRQQNAELFNRTIDQYRSWLAERGFVGELDKGRAEFFFNSVKPFLHAIIIYLCAFLLAGVAILVFSAAPNLSESLRRSAFYLVILAGVVHTFGLIFRMVLEGRPPVTNLYSSAIFIGWATMVTGIIIERLYRVGIGSLVASLAGFVTLLIAQNLAIGGDTMEMMRAVLDTNFWLATHVVVITLGYAATFFAGLLAVLYILLGVFTPFLSRKLTPGTGGAKAEEKHPGSKPIAGAAQPNLGKALSKMVYGVICFATLFSFVGTVLGGIWADQSWGRFWGWDPKENGALLIVLWNAIILHARWGGLVRDRGIMNLAVFGNIVTSFSWFGVNMLGIGLHSYGFMDAAFMWLMLFMISQALMIGMGLLPIRFWVSSGKEIPPPVPPKVGGRAPAAAAS